jgi:putative membrane protein
MQKAMKFLSLMKVVFFLLLTGIVMSSCQSTGDKAVNASMDSAQNLNETKFPASPSKQQHAQYLMTAFASGLYEIRSAKAALKQTTNPDVKRLAGVMIKTNTTINDTISNLAAQKQISLPGDLTQDQKTQLKTLLAQKGAAFDEAYLRLIVDDHKNTIVLLNQAETSSDANIINWAKRTLPAIQEHLDRITTCKKKVDSIQQRQGIE